MASASAFAVVGVYGPPFERGDGALDAARLIQRVRVDRHLHIVCLGHGEAGVDCRGRRAPVLVQLEPHRAGLDDVVQALRRRRVAFAREPDVQRKPVRGLQHHPEVGGRRRAGGGGGAACGAGPAPDERGHSVRHGFSGQLWTNEVHVGVGASGGHDQAFTGDGLGRKSRQIEV